MSRRRKTTIKIKKDPGENKVKKAKEVNAQELELKALKEDVLATRKMLEEIGVRYETTDQMLKKHSTAAKEVREEVKKEISSQRIERIGLQKDVKALFNHQDSFRSRMETLEMRNDSLRHRLETHEGLVTNKTSRTQAKFEELKKQQRSSTWFTLAIFASLLLMIFFVGRNAKAMDVDESVYPPNQYPLVMLDENKTGEAIEEYLFVEFLEEWITRNEEMGVMRLTNVIPWQIANEKFYSCIKNYKEHLDGSPITKALLCFIVNHPRMKKGKVIITSSCNRSLHSYHHGKHCAALDYYFEGYPSKCRPKIRKYIKDLYDQIVFLDNLPGLANLIGFGIYPENFIYHLDTRGKKARWSRVKGKYVSIQEGVAVLEQKLRNCR